jgi:hypothetical protein
MRSGTLPAVFLFLVSTLLPAQTAYPRYRRGVPGSNIPTTGSYKDLAGTFHGTLKQISNKEIVIRNEEDQDVVIRRSRKTKFLKDDKEIKASAVPANALVTVEAAEDIDLKPIAVSLSVDPPPKPERP